MNNNVQRTRWRSLGAVLALSLALGGLATAVQAQSLSDRFKSLFGGEPDKPAEVDRPAAPPSPDNQSYEDCPPVTVRAGASTYSQAAPGKQAVGNDVRFQATITKMAREGIRNGDQITARVGIQGRVIAGPAGAPASAWPSR